MEGVKETQRSYQKMARRVISTGSHECRETRQVRWNPVSPPVNVWLENITRSTFWWIAAICWWSRAAVDVMNHESKARLARCSSDSAFDCNETVRDLRDYRSRSEWKERRLQADRNCGWRREDDMKGIRALPFCSPLFSSSECCSEGRR